jgi:hypothetical protein
MVIASAVILRSESFGIHDHILVSQIPESPNVEGQVPVFMSTRNRMARLYPQALGSIFVASYDSQGCGGGTPTRLHAGPKKSSIVASRSYRTDRVENTSSQLVHGCVLGICCLATGVVYSHYSSRGVHATKQNT